MFFESKLFARYILMPLLNNKSFGLLIALFKTVISSMFERAISYLNHFLIARRLLRNYG